MASKVLTVDDSRVMLRILGSVVESLGLEPVAAQNGKQALEALLKCPDEFRLVMLDWNMPVMDGFETLRAMKADPRLRNIPVMMVTTETEHDSVVRALRAGARHYVSKPFTRQDLSIRIMEALALEARSREHDETP